MKKTLTILAIAGLTLAACGSDPVKPAATSQAQAPATASAAVPAATTAPAAESATESGSSKKVEIAKSKRANCEKFTPIGSNRPQYRCLSIDQKKAETEENEREMRKATAPVGGGVGN